MLYVFLISFYLFYLRSFVLMINVFVFTRKEFDLATGYFSNILEVNKCILTNIPLGVFSVVGVLERATVYYVGKI